MFHRAYKPFSTFYRTRSARTARYFHKATAEFISHDVKGNLITKKVPVIIGNPGEAYVLIDTELGNALRAASPCTSTSQASAEDKCKIMFFHDSLHFGFESSSYPRLYVPNQIPRQTESNASPATLFLSGVMHELALDGTFDAAFAENAHVTARNLAGALEKLKDM